MRGFPSACAGSIADCPSGCAIHGSGMLVPDWQQPGSTSGTWKVGRTTQHWKASLHSCWLHLPLGSMAALIGRAQDRWLAVPRLESVSQGIASVEGVNGTRPAGVSAHLRQTWRSPADEADEGLIFQILNGWNDSLQNSAFVPPAGHRAIDKVRRGPTPRSHFVHRHPSVAVGRPSF